MASISRAPIAHILFLSVFGAAKPGLFVGDALNSDWNTRQLSLQIFFLLAAQARSRNDGNHGVSDLSEGCFERLPRQVIGLGNLIFEPIAFRKLALFS